MLTNIFSSVMTLIKTKTLSSLGSNAVTSVQGRQFQVGLDKDGYLSVNVPYSDSVDPADINEGTLGNKVLANATSQATLANAQVRNITIGTNAMTPGTTALPAGTIYLQVEGD